jgi:ElaB/YqjD/DUF883 family membrane-anchored ribosome-binding protein
MENSEGGAGQLKDTAKQVQQNIREMGGQVRAAAEEKYENLRDQAQEYYEEGRQRAHEWEQGLEQYVQEKPIQSLLIAAGVGMLLGILWKRS